MTVIELIAALRKLQITPSISEGNLKLVGNTKSLPEELLSIVKQNKEDLILFLEESQSNLELEQIPKVEVKEWYKLSNAQRRLWLLSQFEGGNKAYNICAEMYLKGFVDIDKFEKSFQFSIQKHESLRTVFRLENNEPVQMVLDEMPFQFERHSILNSINKKQELLDEIEDVKNHAFDLENGPLIRIKFVTISEDEFALIFCLHHIVSDGWTIGVLLQEIMSNYKSLCQEKNLELDKEQYQYVDFSYWLDERLESEKGNKSKKYWKEQKFQNISSLNLPNDFKRPDLFEFEGAVQKFYFDPDFYKEIEDFAKTQRVTIFNVFRACLSLLLHKLSGQDELIIGTPVSGRIHPYMNNQLGLFVNTLPLLSTIERNLSFKEYLKHISAHSFEAFEHQEFPLDLIIEESDLKRDISRNFLFDVMMVLQNTALGDGTIDMINQHGFKLYLLDKYLYEDAHCEKADFSAKFDLTFNFSMDSINGHYLEIEYRTKLFKKSSVQNFYSYFKYIIEQVIANTDKKIDQIELVNDSEKAQILEQFNCQIDEVTEHSILDLLENSFDQNREKVALLVDNNCYTYQQISEKMNLIASNLNSNVQKVGILLERNEYVLFSVLGILKRGCVYVPIDTNYPTDRIEYILSDANVSVLLVDDISEKKVPESFNGEILNVSKFTKNGELNFRQIDSDDTAYLIYTSGSTGLPKGVEISHKNAIAFLNWANEEFKNTPYEILYAATSYCFDLSVFEMFLPLIQGKKIRLLKSALEIAGLVEHDQSVFLNTVPSVVRNLLDHEIKWENIVALNMAGEPVPKIFKELLDYKTIEIRNLYGPSEDTTYSTCYRFEDGDYESIPIGKPVGYTHLYILDKSGNLVPIGVEGEICLSGLSVAKGYLNKEELTSEKFVNNPFIPGQKMYKSGDIGKWLPDGNIAFIGRNDDQIKVRGYRIELGEIQYQIERIDEIEQAVVVVKEINGENVIVAYWKSNKIATKSDIETILRKHLPAYMLPTYYVALEEIPLNSNGKVDKKKLPEPIDNATKKMYSPPITDLQKQLCVIWQEVLNYEEIGIYDNFFELGGHSLKATKLRALVAKETGKDLTMNDIFQFVTIEQQAFILEQRQTQENSIIVPSNATDYYPLSYSQERLWVLSKFNDASKAYHMPAAFEIIGDVDIEMFEKALNKVVEKHESLRTVFDEKNGVPVQIVLNPEEAIVSVNHVGNEIMNSQLEDYLIADWQKNFDLSSGPLVRCSIIKTETRNILSFNMHHIISDGWSLGILVSELTQAYSNSIKGLNIPLSPLTIQFKDFAIWQREKMTSEVLDYQLNYWKSIVFQDTVPVLELPTDFHRPAVKTYAGNTVMHSFSSVLTEQLNHLCLKNGVSLFMNTMAVVSILFKKLANQSAIVIGTPVAGRDSIQLQDQIGFFVNTLPIKTIVDGEIAFKDYLEREREIILEAFEYQQFPFELLIDAIQPTRDLSRSPLFDAMVVFQNTEVNSHSRFDFNDKMGLKKMDINSNVTKYDLIFSFFESNNQLHVELEYNTDLYKKSTAESFINYLERIFEETVVDENILIKDIQLLSSIEQDNLLSMANNTAVNYDKTATIVSLFEKAAHDFPENIAVKNGNDCLTYRELDEKSGQLAFLLVNKYGVQQEDLVILHTDRSEWMIVAILGVLKAGAAYVPIDPTYPSSRIEYILQDSGSKLILTDSVLSDEIGLMITDEVSICQFTKEQFLQGQQYRGNVHANHLAYVIYTSGTTGNPKGVLIEHENVNRLIFNEKDLFDFNSNDKWSLFHSYCFDFSVWEMYGALLKGGTLVIVSKESAQDAVAFYDFLKNEKITVLNQTPTAFRTFSTINHKKFQAEDLMVRYLIFGGEALMPEILEPWRIAFPACKLVNMYGITETTVHVTYNEITDQEIQNNKSIIGDPIPTLSCYVLDNDLKPVVVGVVGELCVGGAGVARGYHNREDLTKQKFVDHPFIKGEKIYRSGDFARILENGDIEYIGRKDEQVKIRGHRIELGEIEASLLKFNHITDAVVIARKNNQGEYELSAYVITENADQQILNKLREDLKACLPSYMIPTYFIPLNELPLTSNGKLDKKALPAAMDLLENNANYVEPRNEIEAKLVTIWSEILEKEKIGIRDNFFDLGGHSLKATRVLSKIQEEFDVKIDLKNLFIDPTIEHLSNYIDTVKWMTDSTNETNVDAEEMIL